MLKFRNKVSELSCEDEEAKELAATKFWTRVDIILLPLVIIFVIFNLLFFISEVPSGSMLPTIPIDSKIVVRKTFNDYKYGDIVVFYNDYFEDYFVKRLIGEPGDKITITENEIFRNGEKLEESYLKEDFKYREATFEVPEDCYFFLGDNRDESVDSRGWEEPYMPSDNLLGEVIYILD